MECSYLCLLHVLGRFIFWALIGLRSLGSGRKRERKREESLKVGFEIWEKTQEGNESYRGGEGGGEMSKE